MTNDLLKELRYGEIPDEEWFMLFSGMFGMRILNSYQMRYFSDKEDKPENCVLNLEFSKSKRRLKSVVAGPKYTSEFKDKIHQMIDEVKSPSATNEVNCWILFNRFEVHGKLQISNDAQLFQVPEHSPKPSHNWIDGQPFVIEIKSPICLNKKVHEYRARKRFFALNRLLNLILRDGVYEYSNIVSNVWVRNHEEKKTTSSYLQRGYHIEGFKRTKEDFTDISNLSNVPIVDRNIYFRMDGWDGKTPFNIPDNLFGLIKDYDSLAVDERENFDKALYWFSRVYRVEDNDESVNFMCLVSAIEALLPSPKIKEKCDKCLNEVAESIQQRFRDFFAKYAPQVAADTVKQLYEFRSSLAHGRAIHSGDFADDIAGFFGRLNPNVMRDNSHSWVAKVGVRIALINWLGSHGSWMGFRIKDLKNKENSEL